MELETAVSPQGACASPNIVSMISPIGKFSVPPGRVDMRIILIGAWLLREQLHHDPASNMKQGVVQEFGKESDSGIMKQGKEMKRTASYMYKAVLNNISLN